MSTQDDPMKCAACGLAPEVYCGRYLCSAGPYECLNCEVPPLKLDDWNMQQTALIELLRDAFNFGYKEGRYDQDRDIEEDLQSEFSYYLAQRSAK